MLVLVVWNMLPVAAYVLDLPIAPKLTAVICPNTVCEAVCFGFKGHTTAWALCCLLEA